MLDQLLKVNKSNAKEDIGIKTPRISTERWVEKAKKTHGDKYDYTETVYKGANEKIQYNCPNHGVVEQRASHHTGGSGCAKCAKQERINKRTMTTAEFISKAQEVHSNKYSYLNTVYTGIKAKVTITCPEHGDFLQTASDHIQGYGCQKCGGRAINTTEDFIKKAIDRHGVFYDYSKVVYRGAKVDVAIICPVHGEFNKIPSNHLSGQGCMTCQKEKSIGDNKKVFLEKANEIHDHKYKYYMDTYKRTDKHMTIKCALHGEFQQNPNTHLQGKGCPTCGEQTRKDKLKKHYSTPGISNNGWSYTEWENAGKVSEKFQGFSLYVIKCTGNNEEFIKVGKTFKTVANRFNCNTAMPYKYKVVTQVYHNAYAISKLEEKIKKEFKANSYEPKREFAGRTECLSVDVLAEVVKMAEK